MTSLREGAALSSPAQPPEPDLDAPRRPPAASLLTAAIALVLGAWAAWVLASPEHALFLLWDDSFYYLEIARNIATGKGSTFDGLQPTNGYHPLWLLICVATFATGLAPDHAPPTLLLLGLLTWGLVLFAVLRPSPDRPGLLPAAAGLLLGTQAFALKAVANGMESAAVVATHAGVLLMAERHGDRLLAESATRLRLGLGLLLALAFLARTDAGLLAACAIGGLAWQATRRDPRLGLRVFAELGALPLLTLITYLSVNQALFGHMMQVSGELKRVAPSGIGLVAVVVAATVAAGLLLRTPPAPTGPLTRRLYAAPWYLAFLALHLGYYLGLQQYPRQWYFAPELLLLVWLAPAATAALQARARSEAAPEAQDRSALLAAAPLLVVLGFGWLLGVRSALDPGFLPPRLADRDAARWADANLPAGAVLGSWDAGLIGWTCALPVVNLDGVVASHAYLDAMRRGESGAYLASLGVTHVINHHPRDEDGGATELFAFVRQFFGPQAAAGATVVFTQPFSMTASTNSAAHGQHEMATTVLSLPAR